MVWDRSTTTMESAGYKVEDHSLRGCKAQEEIADAEMYQQPLPARSGSDPENRSPSESTSGSESDSESSSGSSSGSDSENESSSGSSSGSDSDNESSNGSKSGRGHDTDGDGDGSSSSASDEDIDEDVDILAVSEEEADKDMTIMSETPNQELKSLEGEKIWFQQQVSLGNKEQKKSSDVAIPLHGTEDVHIEEGEIGFGDQEGIFSRKSHSTVKGKALESEIKDSGKNITTCEAQQDPPGRAANIAKAEVKSSAEGEMPMKASDGWSKSSGNPGLIGRASGTKETSTVDQAERPSQSGGAQRSQFCRPIPGRQPNSIKRRSETKEKYTRDQVERPCQDVETLEKSHVQRRPKQKPTAGSVVPRPQVYGQSSLKKRAQAIQEGEMTMKASDGLPKSSGYPNFIRRKSETREASTEDQIERPSQDRDAERFPRNSRRRSRCSKRRLKTENVLQAVLKVSGEGQKQMRASNELPKTSGKPHSIGRGSETKETSTADQIEKPSQHVETLEKSDVHRTSKQKTTAGILGPGPQLHAQSIPKKRNSEHGDLQSSNSKKRCTEPGDVHSQEFFAPYEKNAAELKGPIRHYDQYLEYCKEYQEKFSVYIRLNNILESDKQHFEDLSRHITVAKAAGDKKKLEIIYNIVLRDYKLCSKRFKRMKNVFLILHDELKAVKQSCKDYTEKMASGSENHKATLGIVRSTSSRGMRDKVGKKPEYNEFGTGKSSLLPIDEDIEDEVPVQNYEGSRMSTPDRDWL